MNNAKDNQIKNQQHPKAMINRGWVSYDAKSFLVDTEKQWTQAVYHAVADYSGLQLDSN
ncbi:MAG: hypothetical protein ACKKL5_03490 [Candidatus Komeilibacteria bacterium]